MHLKKIIKNGHQNKKSEVDFLKKKKKIGQCFFYK